MPNARSEGVVSVLFPRTDFPQQGWIRKPTVEGTAGDFYEALTDFGWFAPTQTPRVNERITAYGRRAARKPQFYTDFPEQGWIRKPTVEATTGDFYEALTDFGFYQESQSFRANPKGLRNWRDRYQIYRRLDQSQPTTVNPNIVDLGVRWPAIETGSDFSYRMPRGRDTKPRPDGVLDEGWIFSSLTVAYDPATNSWYIPDVRMGKRKWWTADPLQPGWIGSPNLTFYEAVTGSSWYALTQDFRARSVHRFVNAENPDNAWIFSVPIAFDPATFVGITQLLTSYRLDAKTKLWHVEQPSFIYPDTYAAVQAQFDRLSGKRPRPPVDQPDASWIFTGLSGADPSTYSGIDQLFKAARLDSRAKLWRVEQPSFIYPDTYPGVQIASDRVAVKHTRLLIDPADVSWIFTNLPSVGAFDPATVPWFILGDRTVDKRKLLLWTGGVWEMFILPVGLRWGVDGATGGVVVQIVND